MDRCQSPQYFIGENCGFFVKLSIGLEVRNLLHILNYFNMFLQLLDAGPREDEAVCVGCSNNTGGSRCNQCLPGYFKDSHNGADVSFICVKYVRPFISRYHYYIVY